MGRKVSKHDVRLEDLEWEPGPGGSHAALRAFQASSVSSEQLTRTAALLAVLADTLHVVLMILDAQGQIVAPQPPWQAFTGQSFSDAVGSGFRAAVQATDRPRFEATWEAGIRSGEAFELRAGVASGDGQNYRDCAWKVTPVVLGPAGTEEWLVVLWPLSEAARGDPATTALLVGAEESRMEALRSLARGVAHQLNNLLHGLLIHVELIRRHIDPASPARNSLEQVLLSTQRGSEFGRQLLSFASRQTGMLESCDLSQVIVSMRTELAANCPAKVRLRFELAERLPLVRAEAERVRALMTTLITNAIEALPMGAGLITLRTGVDHFTASDLATALPRAHVRSGRYVYLEVSDDGVGMVPELQARVFEPFAANKHTGRGLGLPLLLGTIRAWGGLVQVSSEVGRGTRVRLFLPEPASALMRH